MPVTIMMIRGRSLAGRSAAGRRPWPGRAARRGVRAGLSVTSHGPPGPELEAWGGPAAAAAQH